MSDGPAKPSSSQHVFEDLPQSYELKEAPPELRHGTKLAVGLMLLIVALVLLMAILGGCTAPSRQAFAISGKEDLASYASALKEWQTWFKDVVLGILAVLGPILGGLLGYLFGAKKVETSNSRDSE